jgi:hypothetical protein
MCGEERRHMKIIRRAFGEKAVAKLMYAALMRARQGWRNVIVTSFEVKQIKSLRDQLDDQFEQRHASPPKSASRSRIHRTKGNLTVEVGGFTSDSDVKVKRDCSLREMRPRGL